VGKTVIYLRVSTEEQTTDSQEPALREWANKNAPDAIWIEDKVSGASMDRPGWNKIISLIATGEINRIVCWRFDRLSRETIDLLALCAFLKKQNIELVSITQPADIKTPEGELMATLLAAVAKFERMSIKLRQAAGIAAKRDKATGKCPWGGSDAGHHRNALDPEIARQIVELDAQGKNKSEIAKTLKVCRPTVYKVLGKQKAAQLVSPVPEQEASHDY